MRVEAGVRAERERRHVVGLDLPVQPLRAEPRRVLGERVQEPRRDPAAPHLGARSHAEHARPAALGDDEARTGHLAVRGEHRSDGAARSDAHQQLAVRQDAPARAALVAVPRRGRLEPRRVGALLELRPK